MDNIVLFKIGKAFPVYTEKKLSLANPREMRASKTAMSNDDSGPI